MSNKLDKIRQNAQKFELDNIYAKMTPEQYKQGIRTAVKNAVEDLSKEYDKSLKKLEEQYNKSISESVMIAMDTLSVELLYELGNVLECYVEEPEHLEQKIDIVQNIYATAMNSIRDYAGDKYKNGNQVHKVFMKKKKTIEKIFGIYGEKMEES